MFLEFLFRGALGVIEIILFLFFWLVIGLLLGSFTGLEADIAMPVAFVLLAVLVLYKKRMIRKRCDQCTR